MTTKKIKALFEIFLVLTLSIFTSISFASQEANAQENVCCEKTSSGQYCQYVDENDCATGLRDPTNPNKGSYNQAPTSCANTNFCKPGCCYDKEGDGYCYANYPRSNCESQYKGRFSNDPSCSQTAECDQGCCVLGTQAFLSTEIRCRKETSNYTDLHMDFRRDIKTEAACSELARRADKGCCVTGGSCTYGARQECTAPEGDGKGFFKDTYCSQIGTCNCASPDPAFGGDGKATSTRCAPGEDSVYWKDTCGNPEKVKEPCDYTKGTLCGDSDGNGAYTCERLDCVDQDKLSIKLDGYKGTSGLEEGGVLNGESWCQYDTTDQDVNDLNKHSRSPAGSRYYRSLCINGKELVEPCKDYRQEFCVSGKINAQVEGQDVPYTEARCIKNEWQSCIDSCNTADPFKMNEQEYKEALEKDRQCCLQTDKRDCSWAGSRCVPAVGPGFKHWEGEGANTCGKASMECPVVLVCNGFQSLLGQCKPGTAGAILTTVGTVIIGAGAAALIAATAGGAAAGLAFGLSGVDLVAKEITKKPGWNVVAGQECLSKEYLHAANNLCRSYGDCGANLNYQGILSLTGFTNTKELPEEFKKADLHIDALSQERTVVKNFNFKNKEKVQDNPGILTEQDLSDSSWDKGKEFYDFTHKEDSAFSDRFVNRGALGWSAWAPFTAFTLGSIATGLLAPGVSAFAGVGAAGPLGKLIRIIGPESIEKAFVSEISKESAVAAARTEAEKEALESLKFSFEDLPGGELPSASFKPSANDLQTIKEAGETAAEKVTTSTSAQFLAAFNAAAWVDLAYEFSNILLSETKVEKIKTTCASWQAPKVIQEDQCEQCNPGFWKDTKGSAKNVKALKTCSEYRCKSLGLTCSLINQGTGEEQCVSLSKFDTNSPSISAWKEGFDETYQTQIKETQQGIEITETIPIYQTVRVAIQTDEPSQCKMSLKQGTRYKEMEPFYFVGLTYTYFHVQPIFWPAAANVTEGALSLTKGGGAYQAFVRCEDALGNANEKDYFIKFTISKEPDATAPIILGTSIGRELFVTSGTVQTDADVIVNEPSICRWSTTPTSYQDMPTAQQCRTTIADRFGNYNCRFVGTGSGDVGPTLKELPSRAGETKFYYFKCQDFSPAKNFNQEPFKLTIKGSNALNITSIHPQGEIKTSLQLENVTLTVKTANGAKLDGTSVCKYTTRESLKRNIPGMDDFFTETNSSIHTQPLVLPTGQHTLYAGCHDEAGNTAYNQTTFTVTADLNPPEILRAYKQDQPPQFVIVVNENADCEESTTDPDFAFGEGNRLIKDGTHHISLSESSIYYFRCKDAFGNTGAVTTITLINQA